ncbi:hypothetical protein PI124_g21551 [Phytophthora idaei]|nr:hypothetical protein PI124_g21551 [Phytophthora idaei]
MVFPSLTKCFISRTFVFHGFQFGFGGPIRTNSIKAVLQGIHHFFAASGYEFPIAHSHIGIPLKEIGRLDTLRLRKAPV